MNMKKLTIFLVGGLVIALAIVAGTNAITLDEKPVLSNETPENKSINVALNTTLSVYVEDPDGDLMDITINVTNADGGYQAVTYYNAGNGTYSYNLGHIGTYGKTYYWKVSAYDGEYYTNATYHFTTIGLVVNQNTSEEYHTIQDAINNASNGNIIIVHDGIYRENVVVNKSVVIMNGSKPVIDGKGGVAFDITANNVSIIGFNITNSSYGIKCNTSGFYIANNTFWYDDIGFYWNIEEKPTDDYTIYDGIIEKNEFYVNQGYDIIFAYINLNYTGNGPYNVTIGNITIWDNAFYMNGTSAVGIHIGEEIGDLCGGNISAGIVNMSNNKIYGGMGGVEFSGDFYDLTDVNVSAGDVIINKNIMLNQSSGGISTDYYSAGLWNGNTTGTYGDLIINGNKIYSSSNGMYIGLEYFGVGMHDNAAATLGFINISNNIINSSKHGIYFYAGYLGYEMYDNANVAVGKFIIHNNNITANNSYDGIHVCAEYWGYNMSQNSSCSIGNFKITKNNVSCKNGIYFEYFRYVGYNLSGNASVVIGDFAMNDNTVNATEDGIYINPSYFYYWGYEMYDNASIVIGNFSFNRNKIKAGSDGIYLYMYEWATYMYNNSAFYLGEFEFIGNEIEANDHGLYVWPSYMGWYMYDNATAMIGDWYIIWNNITSGYNGIDTGPGVGYSMYDNTSVVMGNFFIMHNNISSSGYYAILYAVYDSGENVYGNSSVVIGETHITNNTVNTSSYAVYFYYYYVAYGMYNNSSLFMEDVYIENNPALNSLASDAIYIYYYEEDVACYMYNNSSARLPDFIIRNNIINASGEGIEMYTYENPEYVYDNSSIYFGGWLIDNNTIFAENGIYLDYDDFCYENYDNSTTEIGNITIINNRIHAGNIGIDVYYNDIGDYLYDNASLIVGNVIIHNNTVNCTYGIEIDYDYVYSDEYSTVKMGYLNITENKVRNCTSDGIYIDYYLGAYDHSNISIKRVLIDGNIIENCSNGIYIYGDIEREATATISIEGAIINNNTISNCSGYDSGIHIEAIDGNEVTNNTLYNCSYGIALIHSANNYIFNNSIYSPLPYYGYYYGIYMEYVNYSNISWNNMIYNISQEESDFTGIYAHHSNNNTMDNNTIEKEGIAGDSSAYGIYMEISTWNIVENNFVFSYDNEAIHLYESSNNTIWNNTLTTNFTYYGARISYSPYNLILNNTIYNVKVALELSDSRNNKVVNNIIENATSHGIEVSSTGNVIDRNTIYNSTGILIFSGSNNIISNNTIRDITKGSFPMSPPGGAAGIWLGSVGTTNNYFFNNTITGSNETCDVYGIFLRDGASNNVFDHIRIGNLNSTGSVYGIYIYMHYIGSNNNTFSNCTIYGMDDNNAYAFYSTENNKNNTVNNMTIASYPTKISFTYGYGIALKGINESEFHPNDDFVAINKFVNVTGVSSSSWINITFWYDDSDVASVNEDSLALYEWNGSSWNEVPFILNESNNCINANVSNFSIYGIFGNLSYTLHKGWNLITVPINVTWHAYELASFINQQYGGIICTTIVMLSSNGHTGWVAVMPDLNNFTIQPGVGYWVFVKENVTLNWHGEIASVDVKLHTGYNLIGWTALEKGNANIALHKIRNASMAIAWNETMHEYETYIKTRWGYHGDNFDLLIGKGFYVYCIATDRWYGS